MRQQQSVFTKIRQFLGITLLIATSNTIAATFEPNDVDKDPLKFFDREPMFDNELSDLITDSDDFEGAEVGSIEEEFAEIMKKVRQRQFKDAHDQVQNLIKHRPDLERAYVLKAAIELHQKDRNAALASFNKALDINAKNQTAMLGIASIDFDEGRSEQAKERIRNAISVNKKTVSSYLLLAEIAYKEKDLVDAEKILLDGLQNVKGKITDEARLLSSLMRLYGMQKQPEKVLVLVQEMNSRYLDHPIALSLLADAQIVNNQMTAAEQTLRKIIRQNARDIRHRMMLANYLAKQPDTANEVVALLDQVSSIAPDNLQLMVQKANILTAIGHYDEAMTVAKAVAVLSPKTKLEKAIEGGIYLAQNKLDQAYEAYSVANQARPNPKILELMVRILSSQGKQADAIALLNSELKKDENKVLAHFGLATLFQQQNDLTQAEKHLEAILAIQPKNPIVLNNLAWLYHQQNKPEALGMAERAFEVAPDSGEIADTLGVVLFKHGELQKAIDILEKAVNLKPNNPNFKFHLAEARAAKGDKKRAIELLETITQANESFESKNRAIEMLGQLKSN